MSSGSDRDEWYAYFYHHVMRVVGPASDDIYKMIKDKYKAEGNYLPMEFEDEPTVDEDPSAW